MKTFRSGLTTEQIRELMTDLANAGFKVDDTLGSHGVCHIKRGKTPVAYISGNKVGSIGRSPYHKKIEYIANQV